MKLVFSITITCNYNWQLPFLEKNEDELVVIEKYGSFLLATTGILTETDFAAAAALLLYDLSYTVVLGTHSTRNLSFI